MALKNIHGDKKTLRNIHADGVRRFRTQIGDAAFQQIDDWLMDRFAESEWVNTTFVAPKRWSDTPLQAIWDSYVTVPDEHERHEQAAKMYGCLVYSVLFDKPETYLYHRPEGHHSDDTRPFGLTYRRE